MNASRTAVCIMLLVIHIVILRLTDPVSFFLWPDQSNCMAGIERGLALPE